MFINNMLYKVKHEKKITILHVGKFFPSKMGIDNTSYLFSRKIAQMGFICDYLYEGKELNNEIYKSIKDFNVIKTPSFKLGFFSSSLFMPFSLKKICNDYDIIHIHYPNIMAALSICLSGYKGKVVLHWHDTNYKLNKYSEYLIRWTIKRADIIVCTSFNSMMTSHLLEESVECNKVVYIPNGVVPIGDIKSKREQIFLNKKLIFSYGNSNSNWYKNLISSANYLTDEYVILIGGKVARNKRLKWFIIKSGLKDKVVLLGRLSDKLRSKYIGMCDIYCSLELEDVEFSNLNIIEAMSCKKPIVALSVIESSWINEDGVTGLNVPIDDEFALANAFYLIFSNNMSYDNFSKNSYLRYVERYSFKKMTNYFIELYMNVYSNWSSSPNKI